MEKHSFQNQTAKLIEEVGAETGYRFRDLAFRIILGINDRDKEFYAAQRTLGISTPQYDAVRTYRLSMSQNPEFSRLWRAAYACIQLSKKFNVAEAAKFFMVDEGDLQEIKAYWISIGRPKLSAIKERLSYDDRPITIQVSPSRVNLPITAWTSIRRMAAQKIWHENYKYLFQRGHVAFEDLLSQIEHYGVSVAMAHDWMTMDERMKFVNTSMQNHLCDEAKRLTAKMRSRHTMHVDDDGNRSFVNRVMDVDDFDMFLERSSFIDPEVSDYSPNAYITKLTETKDCYDQAVATGMFSEAEREILDSFYADEPSERVKEALGSYDPGDWLQWLCTEMGVDFDSFRSKVMDMLGADNSTTEMYAFKRLRAGYETYLDLRDKIFTKKEHEVIRATLNENLSKKMAGKVFGASLTARFGAACHAAKVNKDQLQSKLMTFINDNEL